MKCFSNTHIYKITTIKLYGKNVQVLIPVFKKTIKTDKKHDILTK